MNRWPISVIIPVYNRQNLVKRTLDSVRSQTYRPIKLILVDNNSSDSSLSTLLEWSSINGDEELQVVVASENEKGAPAARNAGLRLADTEWVMFFDSDDVMSPSHIADALAVANRCPDADIVGWDVSLHTLDGKVRCKPFEERHSLYSCVLDGTMATQRYMCRTNLVRRAGGWNNSVRVWNDIEFATRLLLLPGLTVVKRSGPPLVDVFCQEVSITGSDFSSNGRQREHAVDVISASLPSHKRYIANLKRCVLAALYFREGDRKNSKRLYHAAVDDSSSPFNRFLLRVAYHYTRFGGRGIAKITRLLWSAEPVGS